MKADKALQEDHWPIIIRISQKVCCQEQNYDDIDISTHRLGALGSFLAREVALGIVGYWFE